MAEKHTKSLNPLYQIEEDVGKMSFNKLWGIHMLVFYARNIYFPQKEHGKGTSKGQRKNMLRLSLFEVEYEDIQINNHATMQSPQPS